MSQPTHKLTLGKHSEKVTKEQLEAIQKSLGRKFEEYEVTELHVKTPTDVADQSEGDKSKKKDEEK